MMFTTQEDRATVLQAIHDGYGVSLGSAMHHARTARLGPWDDRGMLRMDCTTLMIGELRTLIGAHLPSSVYVSGYGHRLTLHEAVKATEAFMIAYAHARHTIELEAENLLRAALGHDPIVGYPPAGAPASDDALAAAVAEELRLT